MKKSLKERAQEFWAKHKYTILLVGGMTLVGLLGYAANKAEQEEEEKELADIQMIDTSEGIKPLSEVNEPAVGEFDEKHPVDIQEDEPDDMDNDPRLPSGATYRCNDLADNQKIDEDHMDGFGTIIINNAPLSKMGEVGQDIVELCRQAGLEEKGWNNMENGVVAMILGVQSNEIVADQQKEEPEDGQAAA